MPAFKFSFCNWSSLPWRCRDVARFLLCQFSEWGSLMFCLFSEQRFLVICFMKQIIKNLRSVNKQKLSFVPAETKNPFDSFLKLSFHTVFICIYRIELATDSVSRPVSKLSKLTGLWKIPGNIFTWNTEPLFRIYGGFDNTRGVKKNPPGWKSLKMRYF